MSSDQCHISDPQSNFFRSFLNMTTLNMIAIKSAIQKLSSEFVTLHVDYTSTDEFSLKYFSRLVFPLPIFPSIAT